MLHPGCHPRRVAHLAVAAKDMLHLDLSIDAVSSLAESAAKLRAELPRTPPGGWIRGSRYDDAKMAEGRVLTRWDLDAISRDHPILLLQVACHWGVVNSKALELGGLDDALERCQRAELERVDGLDHRR